MERVTSVCWTREVDTGDCKWTLEAELRDFLWWTESGAMPTMRNIILLLEHQRRSR